VNSAPRTGLQTEGKSARSRVLGTVLGILGTGFGSAFALEQTSGVNLTASEGFGARQQGMAVQRAGFAQGADAVVNAPASMNDVNDFTFSTGHAEQFGMARFDNFALLIPWHARSTLGLAVARYSVTGIEQYGSDFDPATESDPDGLFDAADWMVSGAFARRFGEFDVGGAVHLLRRQLDQSGLGMRGDLMGQYTYDRRYRAGAFIRGALPSTAAWEEGLTEYEAPEASLFVSGLWPLPYFYGSLQAGLETPGIFQYGARSSSRLEGERGITDPASVIRTSRVGAEFNFDFGLSLRAGFDELAPSAWGSSARLGMGYHWRNILGIDYAFSAHPYLDQSHRISLRFTPSFPKFEGRNFRPREPQRNRDRIPRPDYRPTYPSPYTPGKPLPDPAPEELEEEELEEGEIQEIVE
jgi:hypothetical protein